MAVCVCVWEGAIILLSIFFGEVNEEERVGKGREIFGQIHTTSVRVRVRVVRGLPFAAPSPEDCPVSRAASRLTCSTHATPSSSSGRACARTCAHPRSCETPCE